MLMLLLTACGTTTIKLNDYISIEVNGYDSVGTASYIFDYDAFLEDYGSTIEINSNNNGELTSYGLSLGETPAELLLEMCIGGDVDVSSGISNGDVVTYIWDCDDSMAEAYFNCKLKYSDISYEVSNLEEIGTFNPFDNIDIEFTGISPDASIFVNDNSGLAEMQHISFSADKDSGLSNGDTITITANIDGDVESFANEFGVIPEPIEQTYTVEGLKSYIASSSEITSEALDKMKQQAKDQFMADDAKNSGDNEKLQSFKYIGSYFLYRKDGMSGDVNYIYLVYKVDYISLGQPVTYYYFTRFKNLILNDDGTCSVEITDYETPDNRYHPNIELTGGVIALWYDGYKTLDDLYKDCVQSNADSYTYEKNINE